MKIPNETQALVRSWHRDSLETVDLLSDLEIDADNKDLITELWDEVSDRKKKLEADQRAILSPLKEAEKAVRAFFKEPLASLSGLDLAIRRKLNEHTAKVRAAEAEAQRALIEATSEEDHTAAIVAHDAAQEAAPEVKVRRRWVMEIVDHEVPRDWCVPDEKRIRAAGRDVQIPGVTWRQVEEVTR